MDDFGMALEAFVFKKKFGFEAPEKFSGYIPERPFAICTFTQNAFTVSESLYVCKDWNYEDTIWIIFRKKAFWLTRKQCKKWICRLKKECDFKRC